MEFDNLNPQLMIRCSVILTRYMATIRPINLVISLRQYTKPAQINSGTDSKTAPASKIKGQGAGNALNTLILANRPRSDLSTLLRGNYCVDCGTVLRMIQSNPSSRLM